MNGKKVILLVEDEHIQGSLAMASLQDKGFVVYWAQTIKEAEFIFKNKNGLFDAILLDGCMDSETPNTQPLIAFFKEKRYEGHIVAISMKEKFSLDLVDAGATCIAQKNEALAGFTLGLFGDK
ncbi:MAG: hypothetical protein ACD_15C00166G0009 [uncultured bacterium]|nr:MAG: hypothetical protein ACD_15C00166G0009 [uncultured bacterium]HCU70359.1 hypothetical protein [Candidatus Moranbacteria bacterium]